MSGGVNMSTFYEYLIEEFGYDEPILVQDVVMKTGDSQGTVRQRLRRLAQDDKLIRVQNGIYFIPSKKSKFGKPIIDPKKVLNKKYLYRANQVSGYQSGLNFGNRLGLTTQTASVQTIVTNEASRYQRIVQIYNNKIIIKKPRVAVTERNYKFLQVLDLLNDFDAYSEKTLQSSKDTIASYLKDIDLTMEERKEIINCYPMKTQIRAYEVGVIQSEVTQ